jgi:DHA1 family inner membrane transport protein
MFSPTAVGSATVIVPPERVGFALSVVITGMTISTALGLPLGTVIGSLGDWRYTMVFVAALAAISFLGVLAFLSQIPRLPAIFLAKWLAPVADAPVALTLFTTILFFTGAFTIYTCFAVVFGRAIGGNAPLFGGLLVVWGVAGFFSNLIAGRLIDSISSRKVLNTMLACVLVDFALLHWSSANLWMAITAIIVWGGCGWGAAVPLQHRLVSIAPPIAPILLGLNNSAIYLGTTAAGIIGAAGIQVLGGGYIAAIFVAAAVIVSELAARRIAAGDRAKASGESPVSPLAVIPDQVEA